MFDGAWSFNGFQSVVDSDQSVDGFHGAKNLLATEVEAVPKKRSMDASTSVPEEQWYHASHDWVSLMQHCVGWHGRRRYMCVDVFSHSKKFAQTFIRRGYDAMAFDIKTDSSQDITSKAGFLLLLDLILAKLGNTLCSVRICQAFACSKLVCPQVTILSLGELDVFWWWVATANCFCLQLRTKDGAFLPIAPPCSLFVGISSGTHRRSEPWEQG